VSLILGVIFGFKMYLAPRLYGAGDGKTVSLRNPDASELTESIAIELINLELCSRLSGTWTKYEEQQDE
jgi:hypothetical protein